MLFTATELAQAGIKPGNLKSVAWNVVGKGSDTMRNVRLGLGCTTQSAFRRRYRICNRFVTGLFYS